MKILVKIPSRSRPDKLKDCLNKAFYLQSTKSVRYLVSLDTDDTHVNEYCQWIEQQPNTEFALGMSNNKIHACNRDISGKWDILVLLSDDMICQSEGWDRDIITRFKGMYEDLDGCLWYSDGYQDRICTMSIMGRKYYERFNYIYHPDYHSLFSDNEFTEVAVSLQKMQKIDTCLFAHQHWANDPQFITDPLYQKNETFYQLDQEVYNRRKLAGFET